MKPAPPVTSRRFTCESLVALRRGELDAATILVRQHRCGADGQRPLDADLRIVPAHASLGGRVVEIRALVEELRMLAQHLEAMRKSWRNPQHVAARGREVLPHPFPERG